MSGWLRRAELSLVAQGWELARHKKHHVWKKGTTTITLSSTEGEGRASRNTLALLKRHGVLFQQQRPRKRTVLTPAASVTPPAVATEPVSQLPKLRTGQRRSDYALSVRQVLVAQEWLANGINSDLISGSELRSALGRILPRWIRDDPEIAERFATYLGSLQPDYETVFSGTFPCECGRTFFTPMARGRHKCIKREAS